MFHTFTPAEGKIEKKKFEAAENRFTNVILAALAMIGASDASDETKKLAKKLVEADCKEVSALEDVGDKMIRRHGKTDKKLWTYIKKIKGKDTCSRGVLAGTTYSGVSPIDSSGFVSANYIGDTMTKKEMQNYIADDKNKKIEEQHAEEEAKRLKVQKEQEAQIWMLHLFRNSPSALVNIIEENAKHTTGLTVEQAEFWEKKHTAVKEYLKACEKTKEKKEEKRKHIVNVIFGGAKLFIGAILAAMTIDEINRQFKQWSDWSDRKKGSDHRKANGTKKLETLQKCAKFWDGQCPICLSEMEDVNNVEEMEDVNNVKLSTKCCNCGHRFHTKCINGWLSTHNTCPICRQPCGEGLVLDEPTNGKTLKTLVAEKTKRVAEKRKQQRDEEKKKEVEKAKTKREDDDSKKEHESSDDSDDYSYDDSDSYDDSEWYDPERDMVMDENGDWRKDH